MVHGSSSYDNIYNLTIYDLNVYDSTTKTNNGKSKNQTELTFCE